MSDVFENFRRLCTKIYSLDPAHFFTTPGLSWEAMLKCTKIKLDLLTDIDQYKLIQSGIRGGLVQCTCRYAKANNKYVENFDSTQKSSYLIYLDANNLYGWAMSQSLPYVGFKWISRGVLDRN